MRLQLAAALGETADQLCVWLAEQRVVFAGNSIYQSCPNVYRLRGMARRSLRDWIASVDKMLQQDPLRVVGGRTTPIRNNARQALTHYRDAMQWMLDRTLDGMRRFMAPDELVEDVQLPERFASLEYLADYYGSVEGAVRDLNAQDLGWFDGNPLSLHRESPTMQSQRIADLAGGLEALREQAQAAPCGTTTRWAPRNCCNT